MAVVSLVLVFIDLFSEFRNMRMLPGVKERIGWGIYK